MSGLEAVKKVPVWWMASLRRAMNHSPKAILLCEALRAVRFGMARGATSSTHAWTFYTVSHGCGSSWILKNIFAACPGASDVSI